MIYIKRIFFASACLSLISITSNAVPRDNDWGGELDNLPPPPVGWEWRLEPRLTDEFKTWDSSKWAAKHGWWNGSGKGRESIYIENQDVNKVPNVQIKNGNLMLYMMANGPDQYNPNPGATQGKWMGAGVVSSKFTASYQGYYEARLKASELPTTSSFWMQSKGEGEIDVVEIIGAPHPLANPGAKHNQLRMHSNYHYHPNGFGNKIPGYRQNPSYTVRHLKNPGKPDGGAHGYHTYGVWWRSPSEMYFYLNGQRVKDFEHWSTGAGVTWDKLVTPGTFVDPIDNKTYRGRFYKRMTMFFDTEHWNWGTRTSPGTPRPEQLNVTDDSNAMQVQWVRSYKLHRIPSNRGAPIGSTIAFLSAHTRVNGYQGVVEANHLGAVTRTASSVRDHYAKFTVEQGAKPGTVSLRHIATNRYLQCVCDWKSPNDTALIRLGGPIKTEWESFTWKNLPQNRWFTLQAHNQKYVRIYRYADTTLYAKRKGNPVGQRGLASLRYQPEW